MARKKKDQQHGADWISIHRDTSFDPIADGKFWVVEVTGWGKTLMGQRERALVQLAGPSSDSQSQRQGLQTALDLLTQCGVQQPKFDDAMWLAEAVRESINSKDPLA